MATEGKSGRRVVAVLLGLVAVAVFAAWLGFKLIFAGAPTGGPATGMAGAPRVLADGIVYEARSGDPGLVIAQDTRSGREVWRAELGTITRQPALVIEDEVVEVQIAGTSWMTLDRATGKPIE